MTDYGSIRAEAMVQAVTHYQDPQRLLEISTELKDGMKGQAIRSLQEEELFAGRGA